jgi:hypothetical protein
MKTKYRISLAVFLVLLLANLYIYKNRNKGYEFLNQCSYETIYPCCDSSDAGIKKWYRHMNIYPAAEVQAARAYSKTEFGIEPADSAFGKVYKIMKPLYGYFYKGRRLLDRSDYNYAGPLEQYKILKENGYIISENAYAGFLHFFSRSNDVLIRHVQTTGHINEHVFSEVFLPEQKKWVYTDVSGGIASVRDKRNGRLLNCADIMIATDKNEIGQLEINFLGDSAGVYRRADTLQQYFDYYFAGTNVLYYYYTVDLNKVYDTWFKLKHYFSKASWHETYTHLKLSNRKFYIKQAAAIAGLISFLVFGYFFVRYKMRGNKKHASTNSA